MSFSGSTIYSMILSSFLLRDPTVVLIFLRSDYLEKRYLDELIFIFFDMLFTPFCSYSSSSSNIIKNIRTESCFRDYNARKRHDDFLNIA